MKRWRKCKEDCFNCKYDDCIKPEEFFRTRDYEREYERQKQLKIERGYVQKRPHKKHVIQYKSDGSLVAEYESVAKAGQEMGGSEKFIAKAARTGVTAYGYIWKYA